MYLAGLGQTHQPFFSIYASYAFELLLLVMLDDNHIIWLQIQADVSSIYRTSRSEFIVSVNRYLEAKTQKLSVGMRFKMRFEGEEAPEKRYHVIHI